MAPDRGTRSRGSPTASSALLAPAAEPRATEDHGQDVIEGQSFTFRGVAVGIVIGIVLAFSNMYFGLQTGWISTMTMPASLLGYGFFRTLSRHLKLPFTPVENVLVQTVAASVGIVPLGAGFVGVIPAMNYLLLPEEMGPFKMTTWQSIVWSLGLCYFGCVFAVLLRRQVVIKERLRFPSGFSTAVLIGVLHGQTPRKTENGRPDSSGGFASLAGQPKGLAVPGTDDASEEATPSQSQEWKANLRLLLICFCISGVATVATYFLPVLRNLPVFGSAAAAWLWTLNPSLAYVGQGIIMGPSTTIHMLIGAIVGWGILSPLAKHQGWAPGSIDDWENGSKGWIVWTSLSIMLADAIVSLGFVATSSLWPVVRPLVGRLRWWKPADDETSGQRGVYAPVGSSPAPQAEDQDGNDAASDSADDQARDCPPDQDISPRFAFIGLPISMVFCVAAIRYVFQDIVPLYAIVTAVLVAIPLSVIAVRAMGVTDLNPVSGISKLAQLFFALVIPRSNKAGILINLVAGAVVRFGLPSPITPLQNDVLKMIWQSHFAVRVGRPPSWRSDAGSENRPPPGRRSQGPVPRASHRGHRRRCGFGAHLQALHEHLRDHPKRSFSGPHRARLDFHGKAGCCRQGPAAHGHRVCNCCLWTVCCNNRHQDEKPAGGLPARRAGGGCRNVQRAVFYSGPDRRRSSLLVLEDSQGSRRHAFDHPCIGVHSRRGFSKHRQSADAIIRCAASLSIIISKYRRYAYVSNRSSPQRTSA
ncbi:hypothetical protein RB601_001128 [Gaeumannomyces tritici]